MRVFYLIPFALLFSCTGNPSDSEFEPEPTPTLAPEVLVATITIEKGTKLILCDSYHVPIDTVTFEEETPLLKQNVHEVSKDTIYECTIRGLNKTFKDKSVLNNLYFKFKGLKLIWVSSDYHCNFFLYNSIVWGEAGKSYNLDLTGGNLYFLFGSTYDKKMQIDGKIKISDIKLQ